MVTIQVKDDKNQNALIYLYIRNYHKWLHIIEALGRTKNEYNTTTIP